MEGKERFRSLFSRNSQKKLYSEDTLSQGSLPDNSGISGYYKSSRANQDNCSQIYQKQEDSICQESQRACQTNRRETVNYECESSSSGSKYLDRVPSQSEFYCERTAFDSRSKDLEPNVFSKDLKGNKLQLIEKLDIGRCNDEENEPNIDNELDDSLIQDQIMSNFKTCNPKADNLSTKAKVKSRNFRGIERKFRLKGLKTSNTCKENIPNNSDIGNAFKNQGNSSFSMNQNHLHLHVNVTNSDFRCFNKSGKRSSLSDIDRAPPRNLNRSALGSNQIKRISKENLLAKKNKLQYTPLTMNGILKENAQYKAFQESGPEAKQRESYNMSLSHSSITRKPSEHSSINPNAFNSACVIQKNADNSKVSSRMKDLRSMSSKNLKNNDRKNLRRSMSFLRRSISPFNGVQTYKQDAIKLICRRFELKIKEYFYLIKEEANRKKVKKKPRKISQCTRQSISSLKKAIGYCKDIETSFEKLNNNSPNTNRIKKSNELRRSIQALGAHCNSINQHIAHLEERVGEGEQKRSNANGFIIQPDLDIHKQKIIGRRNSGVIKNQNCYVELSAQTLDQRNAHHSIMKNSGYTRHESSDSDYFSPKIYENSGSNIPATTKAKNKCLQSTQEVPRMNLFTDILNKFIQNYKKREMKSFMINLYHRVYPQLDNYVSRYEISQEKSPKKQEIVNTEAYESTKSTGRFKLRNDLNEISSPRYSHKQESYFETKDNYSNNGEGHQAQEMLKFKGQDDSCGVIQEHEVEGNDFSNISTLEPPNANEFTHHLGNEKYHTTQNRYDADINIIDSFCEPEFTQEASRPPSDFTLHRRSPSHSMAQMIWRLKKRAAGAIFERYRFEMKHAFDKWRTFCDQKEIEDLRKHKLSRIIFSKHKYPLRAAMNKLKLHCKDQIVTEQVNKTLVNRWRKRYVFKVFKILRNSHAKSERTPSKTQCIPRKKIKKVSK
ncbi:unnamed protein product [Moneuplotes crassus]|uniref:Uncharacterized protein n=1 Tax=Euplotes crassus TaxID=5936 RepID=A0AAD1XV75_EUPCR|nr:unnamed protein product [Moneuplotes crassus]